MKFHDMLHDMCRDNKSTLAWFTICSIGLLVQGYQISSEYFSYDISTNVQLTTPDDIEVPTIIFCTDLIQLIKWHEMTQQERKLVLHLPFGSAIPIVKYDIKNETEESIRKLPLSLKKQLTFTTKVIMSANLQRLDTSRLFELTHDHKELFDSIRSYVEHDDPKGKRGYRTYSPTEYEDLFEAKEFIFDLYKCYSFKRREEFQVIKYLRVMRQSYIAGNVYRMQISKKFSQDITFLIVSLLQNNHSMTNGFFAFVPVNVGEQMQFLKYQTFDRKLLPKPFQTKCIDYTDLGFDSRGKCYEQCLLDAVKYETKGTKIPPAIGIYFNETSKVINLLELESEEHMPGKKETYMQMLDRYQIECESKCHAQDCKLVTHIPTIIAKLDAESTWYSLYLPVSPTISASCHEAVSLIQFMTDMVSALGFWLGVSAFGIWETASKFWRRYSKANQSKVEVTNSRENLRKITHKQVHQLPKEYSNVPLQRMEHLINVRSLDIPFKPSTLQGFSVTSHSKPRTFPTEYVYLGALRRTYF